MTSNAICKLLKFDDKESKLFMPNEIFEDLKRNIKNTPHISFSYTYLYFTAWLYRYAKYFTLGESIIDNTKIKEILGYDPSNRTLNYLIKKNGLLDKMEYTESTREIPISWEHNEEGLSFLLTSEVDAALLNYFPKIPTRFFLKKPLKGFYRIKIDENGEEYEEAGTFFDVSNTHMIPFEVFAYSMSNKDIGCTGFYLYSYLKYRNGQHEKGYDVSLQNLAEETGISETSLDRYMSAIKKYRMVDFRHNQDYFILGLDKDDRRANTYITRDFDFFNEQPVDIRKIKVMKLEAYNEMKEKEAKRQQGLIESDPVHFDADALPF